MDPTTPIESTGNDNAAAAGPVTPEFTPTPPTIISPTSPTPIQPPANPAATPPGIVPVSEIAPSPAAAPIDPLHPAVMQTALNQSPSVAPANEPASPETPAPVFSSSTLPPAVVVGGDMNGPLAQGTAAAAATPPARRKRLPLKSLLVALAALVVVGAGSAAAYAAIIVPNQPANVLKAALANSLQQKQVSFVGTLQGGPATGTGVAYKATFNGAEDIATKNTDFQLNLTVSGVTFPVEARLVNQNLYIKVGDISSLTSLIGSVSPDLASIAQSLSTQLSNKWIEFDSTLLNSAGASCALNANLAFSKADVQLLENQYGKNPFVTIQSTSSDIVNGKKVEKLVLSVNDNKLAAYTKNLNGLSLFKTIKNCEKGSSASTSTSSLADGDSTPLTIWVDKSTKQIVQVSSQSTAADAKKDNIKVGATVTLKYGKVTITAPTGAEPAAQLIASLESSLGASGAGLTDLLGSSSSGGNVSTDTQAQDAIRQTDLQSLQTQLEAYFAQYGNYPSLTEMNSASWRQANMSGLDENALKDPSGSSETLAAKPAAKVYAYQVTSATGGSCESDATQCAQYTLTATLSSGQTYTKNNLD